MSFLVGVPVFLLGVVVGALTILLGIGQAIEKAEQATGRPIADTLREAMRRR